MLNVGADLGAASSVIASMRQAGLPYGTPAVIAVMAVNQAARAECRTASLQASTVVVNDFPGSTAEQCGMAVQPAYRTARPGLSC